jgi:hypothetical protein
MFARITQGSGNPTAVDTNKQALILDSKNGIVETVRDDGAVMAHQTSLFVQSAQTALATITTAQNLFNQTLAKNTLNKLGRTLYISGSLIYTSPGTTAPTLTIALVLGAVTLCSITTAALSTTASTNMPVQFSFLLNVVSTGAAATIEAHGQVTANISANTPAAAAVSYLDTNTAVSSAVDLTAANALKVTIAASLTVTSAQLRQLTVEVVN